MIVPQHMKNTLQSISAYLVVIALLSLVGCSSYRLGTPAPIPFDSIYIRPANNESYAPQAQAIVSSQIREAFITDGRLKIVSDPEEADAVLIVKLKEYKRQAGARDSNDTTSALDFDLQLIADISLYNQNAGDYYFTERTVTERSTAYINNPYGGADVTEQQSYAQSEYQAMPRIARDLGRKIANVVLSPW